MVLSGEYCFSMAPYLKWSELKYGYDRAYISTGGVAEYALDSLSLSSPPLHYELAAYRSSEKADISMILERLIFEVEGEGDGCGSDDSSREIWLYLTLSWIYANRDFCQDPFEMVEDVYADFDYPEEVATIIRYMPPKEGAPVGEAALMSNWEAFLKKLSVKLEDRVAR